MTKLTRAELIEECLDAKLDSIHMGGSIEGYLRNVLQYGGPVPYEDLSDEELELEYQELCGERNDDEEE